MATRAVICTVCSDLVAAEREGEHLAAHLKAMQAPPSRAKQAVFSVLAWLVLALGFAMLGSLTWLLVRLAMRA